MDKQKNGGCMNCRHSWLLESKALEFHGTAQQLKNTEKRMHRSWNHCYCGQALY